MIDRGKRLEHAMRLRGFRKQHALAHLLGVTESTVTRWKKNKAISVDHAIALCCALDISLDWFLRGIGPIDSPDAGDMYPAGSPALRHDLEEESPSWPEPLLSGAHGFEAKPSLAHHARYNH